MAIINEKAVEHLAALARIEITSEMLNVKSEMDANRTGTENVKSEMDEREKIAGDLEKILKYFEELKELDTDSVLPMSGGMLEANIMRNDETRDEQQVTREKGQETRDRLAGQFPEEQDGFLKVPAVFN